MLKENDLFEGYVTQRFVYYFQNWYLQKLKLVQPGDELESVKLLDEIVDLYGDIEGLYNQTDKVDVSITRDFIELSNNKNFDQIIKNYIKSAIGD